MPRQSTNAESIALRQLAAQSRNFLRSRRELIRRVIAAPYRLIPVLIPFAGETIHEDGQHIAGLLGSVLDSPSGAELVELIYREIPKYSVHFVGLAVRCCEVMLARIQSVRPRDLMMESDLTLNLAVHLRHGGDLERATHFSEVAVRLARRLSRRNPFHRTGQVVALCLWSKHLSESRMPVKALRVARQAVSTALQIKGKGSRITLARALVVLGAALVATNRSGEAKWVLSQAIRTFSGRKRKGIPTHPEAAHALMFLACAELNSGRLEKASAYAEAAWNHLKVLVAEDTGVHVDDFLCAADILATTVGRNGDELRIQQIRAEAGQVLRKLSQEYPERYGVTYVRVLLGWARDSLRRKDFPTALKVGNETLREYQRLMRRLRSEDPEISGGALFTLAVAHFELKQPKEAVRAARLAELELLRLPTENKQRLDMLPWLEELTDAFTGFLRNASNSPSRKG